MDINKIIAIVRTLNEDGAISSGPTMNTASTTGKAGFGGSAQGFNPGPTAGYDPVMGMTRRKEILGKGKYAGARTRWKKPQP
jgi:hypothetical protein